MWGSDKNKIRSSKIDTLIGHGIEINGDVKFDGGLHLDGKIIGNAVAEVGGNSVFIVSDKGCVEGDISVSYAIINGEVIGNVYASEKLELSSKARITGDVHYSLLEMASGAEVNGKMVHESEKKLLEHHVETDENEEHGHGFEQA
ncbi:MAG: polymer-forming cytoskeletal protein [Gammaproteobacteria bacterium]|nr:polymer-forming cytoskeletal protein [Gammaproteobacteria bacterium]